MQFPVTLRIPMSYLVATPGRGGAVSKFNKTVTTTVTNSWAPDIIKATAQVLSSAAWPIGLVVLAFLFQRQISNLLNRIRSFKGAGIEVLISELSDKLTKQVPDIGDAEATEALGQPVTDLVSLSPIDAVVTSWLDVEKALNNLYEIWGGRPITGSIMRQPSDPDAKPLRRHGRSIALKLMNERLIPRDTYDRIRLLSDLRNNVVHAPEEIIENLDVQSYVRTAASVVSQLNESADKAVPEIY